MRIVPRIVALSLAALLVVALAPRGSQAQSLCSVLGIGSCFFGGGGQPACGCASGCGVDGRQFAGQAWEGCQEDGPRSCYCTDASGRCSTGHGGVNSCGCGGSCEPSCASGPSCGCNSGGCGGSCSGGGTGCCLFDGLFGCTGCSSELYWCEWHNDPPRCCDPCDQCGNWIGPGAGYRAPYAHPYAVNGQVASPYYANQRTNQNGMASRGIAQPIVRMQSPTPARSPYVAGRVVNPPSAAPAAKKYAANLTTRTPPQAQTQAPLARRPNAGGTYRPMPW